MIYIRNQYDWHHIHQNKVKGHEYEDQENGLLENCREWFMSVDKTAPTAVFAWFSIKCQAICPYDTLIDDTHRMLLEGNLLLMEK